MHLLDSSISILDAGVSDYPRLSKVLQTTRVCMRTFHSLSDIALSLGRSYVFFANTHANQMPLMVYSTSSW